MHCPPLLVRSGADLKENSPVGGATFDPGTGLWTVSIENTDTTYQVSWSLADRGGGQGEGVERGGEEGRGREWREEGRGTFCNYQLGSC